MNELYRHLIEAYKKHRQTVSFDDENAYEIYKWQLITACQGKTPIEIIRAHNNNPNKAEKGGFVNLIDVIHDNTVLKYLATNNPAGLQKTLDNLVDESISLNNRLAKFKSSMAEMLQGTNFNSKANDERTAATILSCHNPQKYTFYKNEIYQKLCAYLGEPTQRAGKKYEHYLSLIEPLAEMISQDKELQSIIDNSVIANLLQSNLLIAQDVCWVLLVTIDICWLLTWNPQNWSWDDYDECVRGTKNGKTYIVSWTCSSKQPKVGEQVFLMKIGDSPRGIIARGRVSKPSYDAPHYDSEKAAANVMTRHIDVELDDIRDFRGKSILPIEKLNEVFPEQMWTPQSSGIQIKCDVKELQKLWEQLQINSNSKNMDEYVNLLKSTHNLILTGAPGTGKTYLAKKIAEAMGCTENEIGFVQFHPSYDYTDFVEGLRPINDENGNVGFERKDGVFKTFCAKAVALPKNDAVDNFNETWDKLVATLNENNYIEVPFLSNKSKSFRVELNEYGTGLANRTYPNDQYEQGGWISGQSKFFSKDQLYNIYKGLSGVPSGGHDNYRRAIVEEMKNGMGLKPYKEGNSVAKSDKKFVFIIDEINRGEISKIFGELFFSIDPGYRGKKGKVRTQYANMVESPNEFDIELGITDPKNYGHFFVPENVYIIGTMNDIDRSVESMDFAFRRRFAFKEIKANENTEMLDQLGSLKDEAIQRMTNLNAAIEKVEGLSSAYHIGASYFLKVKDYGNDFGKLWEYHLEGLLREYLRGMQGVEETIIELKKAYDNGVADSNNGQ